MSLQFRTLTPHKGIKYLVIHHTGVDVDQSAQQIHDYHLSKRWAGIGYHALIRRDGTVEAGRPLDMAGAHVIGHNSTSLGVALTGDFRTKDPTPEQLAALRHLLSEWSAKFPGAKVMRHKDLDRGTECPGRLEVPLLQAPAPERPGETRPSAPTPGAMLNVALCRPADIDLAIPPAPYLLSEIVWGYAGPGVIRASNANLFTPQKALGLVWSGGKFAGQDQWACHNWPVLAIYDNATRSVILPEGWQPEHLQGLRCAVAGAPLLVRDGQPVAIPAAMQAAGIDASIQPNERIPRTAVGVRGDGMIVHAVTESATLPELAQAMAAAGCVSALNMDGGGSTGLVEGGKVVMGANSRRLPCALVIRQVVTDTPSAPPQTPISAPDNPTLSPREIDALQARIAALEGERGKAVAEVVRLTQIISKIAAIAAGK